MQHAMGRRDYLDYRASKANQDALVVMDSMDCQVPRVKWETWACLVTQVSMAEMEIQDSQDVKVRVVIRDPWGCLDSQAYLV
jgi:hypothetical protein